MLRLLKLRGWVRQALVFALTFVVLSSIGGQRAEAHFSYSDPRIVHIAEAENGGLVILVRMPAPLALLPDHWQGSAETRLPPFARGNEDDVFLDREAITAQQAMFHQRLLEGISVELNGMPEDLDIGRTRFWLDTDRPSFGTIKSALKSLDTTPLSSALPYFDSTLDVEFIAPAGTINSTLHLTSDLGQNFQVIDKFGTVVKLHRADGNDTVALIGVLDAEFPGVLSQWERLLNAAHIGAEHIYRGLDHLAMILLIALAATGWRQALGWASAFTVGHVLTLAAGLYGYAPQASWFVPAVELLIVLSIVVAGLAIVFRRPHLMSWHAMFIIGMIHGYGFASAASVALFTGDIDPAILGAFAIGLELCQFAVYFAVLPLIALFDRLKLSTKTVGWRQPVALCLAIFAGISVIQQIGQMAGFSVA